MPDLVGNIWRLRQPMRQPQSDGATATPVFFLALLVETSEREPQTRPQFWPRLRARPEVLLRQLIRTCLRMGHQTGICRQSWNFTRCIPTKRSWECRHRETSGVLHRTAISMPRHRVTLMVVIHLGTRPITLTMTYGRFALSVWAESLKPNRQTVGINFPKEDQ